jgi:DNA-binding response OmpR family regulator
MTTAREQELEEEVRQLRALLGCNPDRLALNALQTCYKLTPYQATILLALYKAKGECLPEERLILVNPRPCAKGVESNTVCTQVSAIRRAVSWDSVRNFQGQGYAITPAGAEKVRHTLHQWLEAAP